MSGKKRDSGTSVNAVRPAKVPESATRCVLCAKSDETRCVNCRGGLIGFQMWPAVLSIPVASLYKAGMGEMIAVVCSGRMSVAAGIGPPKSISSRCVPGMG